MQSIILAPEERKDLIRKMKRERGPSRRLRMPIVVLCADGPSPTEIARVLFWMRKGKQRPLKTPGTNRKVWISGALNIRTGGFQWVRAERKNDELFIRLLEQLRRTYCCHKELHLALDNDASHTSKRVENYVQDSGGRIRLHPLPPWSPQSKVQWSWCGGLCTKP